VTAPTPPHHRLEMATPLLPSVMMEFSAQLAKGACPAHPFLLLYLPRPLELPRPFTHSPGKLASNSYLPTGPMYFVFGRLSPYSLHGHHGIVWLLPVISPRLTNTVSLCGLAYPYDWRVFVGAKRRRYLYSPILPLCPSLCTAPLLLYIVGS
jgi:hypothetical protein